MPILFVVIGVLFLLIVFGFEKLFDFKSRYLLLLFIFIFEVGYFVGNVEVLNISFNVCHLLVFFALLALVINLINLRLFLIAIISSLIYYLVSSLGYVLSNISWLIDCYYLLLFLCCVLKFEYKKCVAFLLLNLLGVLLIDLYFDFQKYTFAELNFINAYNFIFLYSLFCLMILLIRRGICYGKKNYTFASFMCYNYCKC